MAQRVERGMPSWLAFVLGVLVAGLAAVMIVTLYGTARPLATRPLALNLTVPHAPSLPDAPKLPPPPIPTPK
jgi:hypothetical protein